MQIAKLARNTDLLLKLEFSAGIAIMIVVLLSHDPFVACLGFLMVGMPALHWYVASPHSQKLGRFRTPVLATLYLAVVTGILVLLGWVGQRTASLLAS